MTVSDAEAERLGKQAAAEVDKELADKLGPILATIQSVREALAAAETGNAQIPRPRLVARDGELIGDG